MTKFKTILDVRSEAEYEDGYVENSVNIPLDQVMDRLEEIKNLPSPLLVCCASGKRGSVVNDYLIENGIESFNGGAWEDVQSAIANRELHRVS